MKARLWSRAVGNKSRRRATSKPAVPVTEWQAPYSVLLGVLVLAIAIPAIGSSPPWPSLVMPPSQEHHVGKVIFVELVTPDLAATERFYSGLLGWVFQNDRSGDRQYAAALVNGHLVAELMQKPLTPGTRRQPAWLGFLAVRDVDATERSALQDGAKLLYGPRDFPGRGREAVFSDPQGAVFAVLASSSGDPPDTLAAPGEWIWSALITNDPDADADAAFYQKLFHYEIYDVTGDAAEQHLLLASDSCARASANTLPGNRSVAYSHWLNFIRVNDAAAMSARVVALGGRVLVEPRIDRHGGMVAVVADPNGTPFGLLEWPDAETKLVMP